MSADSATNHEVQPAAAARPAWKKRLIRAIRAVCVGYLLLNLLLFLGQRQFIFPGSMAPTAKGTALSGAEPFTITSADGNRLWGVFCPANDLRPGEKAPTVLFFYGNGSQVGYSTIEIEMLQSCGANVFVVDYPGYGRSEGSPSEAGLYHAASALWDYAASHPQVDQRQIVLVGWSMGGAVAIDLASRRPAAGLITVSTFTSMAEMACHYLPYCPTSISIRHHFRNIRKLGGMRMPIVIAHGTDDEIVPFRLAADLRDAAPTTTHVEYVPIERANHNNVFIVGRHELQDATSRVLELVRTRALTSDISQ